MENDDTIASVCLCWLSAAQNEPERTEIGRACEQTEPAHGGSAGQIGASRCRAGRKRQKRKEGKKNVLELLEKQCSLLNV